MPHLDFSPTSPWSPQLGAGWKGTRLLGSGNNGSVALFEWHSPIPLPSSNSNPSKPTTTPSKTHTPNIHQIALKQTLGPTPSNPFANLKPSIMHSLLPAKSLHVVRIYKTAEPVGRRKELLGIYMEFCPGGCLGNWLRRLEGEGGWIQFWSVIFGGCFVVWWRGVGVMERGCKDAEGEWNLKGKEGLGLVHYDIKLDNIFLGYKGPSHGHERYPVLKIGDFGCAQWEPQANNPAFHRKPRNRGAPGWRAPEHTKEAYSMTAPRTGACSNIFQIGLIMSCLLNRELDHPATRQNQVCRAPSAPAYLVGKQTYGSALLLEKWKMTYSLQLRELIVQCLMWEPGQRPGVMELQRKVKEGLDLAWEIAGEKELEEPVSAFVDVGYFGGAD